MSSNLHIDGDFTLNLPNFEGDFTENTQPDIQADFINRFAPDKVSQLENDLNYQTQEQMQEAIQAESDTINARIDSEVADLEQQIHDATLDIQGSDLIGVSQQEQTVTITSKTFVFEQGIAASVWEIEHPLNKKPSVTVTDSAGEEKIPDRKVYNSDNKVTLYFLAEFSGKALLN
jgi:hypothetical protein